MIHTKDSQNTQTQTNTHRQRLIRTKREDPTQTKTNRHAEIENLPHKKEEDYRIAMSQQPCDESSLN